MLQENGIEDFRPLDVSLEADGDQYEGEKYKNGVDQISLSDSSKDGGYDLRDMPEYNVETKADFKWCFTRHQTLSPDNLISG